MALSGPGTQSSLNRADAHTLEPMTLLQGSLSQPLLAAAFLAHGGQGRGARDDLARDKKCPETCTSGAG